MAEAQDYIDIFVNSAPLGCEWPKKTVLIANGKIYQNAPGRHAERVFLDNFEETRKAEGNTVNIYLNYSPCDECCTAILNFLKTNSEVTFHIKFTHVYYTRERNPDQIRNWLRQLKTNLPASEITLEAVKEEDWKEITRLIFGQDQGREEWAQFNAEEWNMTKGSIVEQQVHWEDDLDNALKEKRNMKLAQTCKKDVLEEIMTKDHENWGTELGRYLKGKNKRELHNIAMQFLYNHGKDSLKRIVDPATGAGYAILLRVLKASREAETEETLLQLLRKRIIADFVADKEFRCIIDKQIDGEADAAVGNEAAAAE